MDMKKKIFVILLENLQNILEFKNCMHVKEQNCEIKKAVEKGIILKSRYENYCSFIK